MKVIDHSFRKIVDIVDYVEKGAVFLIVNALVEQEVVGITDTERKERLLALFG
ncbi:hypothetical protein ACFLST_01355 [Chloroflexota bacterium]